MNKKLQELLKTVDPYTDKTLCEGCLIQTKDLRKLFYIQPHYSLEQVKKHIDSGKYKILWHLDLSTILRYIENKKNKSEIEIYLQDGYSYIWENDQKCIWKFPNKPLITYSEEELEKLISLLNELWKQQDK